MRISVITTVAIAMLCATTPVQAALWTYPAILLDGLQEVPPVATPATGLAQATLDDATGAMSITGSYSNLIANVTAAHLHAPAPPGVNAGVVLPLSTTGGTSGTFSGNGILSAANVANVLNGLSYINVHTTFRPGGEIRGQLLNPVPEPTTGLLLATGASGLLLLRRRRR